MLILIRFGYDLVQQCFDTQSKEICMEAEWSSFMSSRHCPDKYGISVLGEDTELSLLIYFWIKESAN